MQNFDANSRNERTNEHTNGRTDRKGENYIPVGINAGGIMIMNVYINCCLWEILHFSSLLLGRYLQSHLIKCSKVCR